MWQFTGRRTWGKRRPFFVCALTEGENVVTKDLWQYAYAKPTALKLFADLEVNVSKAKDELYHKMSSASAFLSKSCTLHQALGLGGRWIVARSEVDVAEKVWGDLSIKTRAAKDKGAEEQGDKLT